MAAALIGAGLELAEFLGASAGGAVETGLLEAGASESVAAGAGSAAGGAVKGGILSTVESAVQSAGENAVDFIFGEGTAAKVESKITEAEEITKDFITTGSFSIFDPQAIAQKRKQRYEEAFQHNITETEADKCVKEQAYHYDQTVEENLNQKKDPYQTGKDLGKLLSVTATEISLEDQQTLKKLDSEKKLFKRINTFHPDLGYLFESLFDHKSATGFQPMTPEYQKISAIYNGNGLSVDKVTETINEKGLKNFSAANEVGEIKTWIGKNDYVVIPTLHGYWVGPNSRNDVKPVDLLDLYSMFHDIDYQDNDFGHKESDLKFLSRISQNLEKMGFAERAAAKVALNYFSTLGGLVSFVLGNDEIGKKDVSIQESDSIYTTLIKDPQYQTVEFKEEFKQGISDGLEEGTITSSAFSLGARPVNPIIYQDVMNLEIQID